MPEALCIHVLSMYIWHKLKNRFYRGALKKKKKKKNSFENQPVSTSFLKWNFPSITASLLKASFKFSSTCRREQIPNRDQAII